MRTLVAVFLILILVPVLAHAQSVQGQQADTVIVKNTVWTKYTLLGELGRTKWTHVLPCPSVTGVVWVVLNASDTTGATHAIATLWPVVGGIPYDLPYKRGMRVGSIWLKASVNNSPVYIFTTN